jgi:hypothetical protein
MFVNLECPECGAVHEFNIEIDIDVSTKKQNDKIETEIVSIDLQEKEDFEIDSGTIEIWMDRRQFNHKQMREIEKDLKKAMSKHGIEADSQFIE